ncbi:MAG: site-specific integrase [Propionibacteriaceae bacterium]|nr:site-specific integrase [Propionibacteriaceae bacterium]
MIEDGKWTPPAERRKAEELASITLGEYSESWLASRTRRGLPLKARTVEHYTHLLGSWLKPLAKRPMAAITRAEVDAWYHAPDLARYPTTRQHAYALGRAIMRSAIRAGHATANPFDVEGATAKCEVRAVDVLTVEEVTLLADAMPPRHRVLVLLAAWCGLRFGELAGLTREDVTEDKNGLVRIHVRRAVVTVGSRRLSDTPKSRRGYRTVIVPPPIAADVLNHRRVYAQRGHAGLIFPPTNPATDYLTAKQVKGTPPGYVPPRKGRRKPGPRTGSGFYLARAVIGHPNLRFHDLRHFAGTSYAIAGATARELMDFMGHADLKTTQIYQHTAKGRAEILAGRMGDLARGGLGGDDQSRATDG